MLARALKVPDTVVCPGVLSLSSPTRLGETGMRGPFKQPALLFWLSPSFFLSLSFSPTRLVIMTGGTRANETVVDFPSLLLCRASVSPLSPMLPSRTWTLGDLAFFY